MATRWMKWNEGTHIFEYSTDGVNFNPLPLDASILTQGVLDPARLPPGVPSGGGNNVFTGLNTLSGVAPTLRWNETDAPADAKNWEMLTDAQLFKIRLNNDAWSVPVDAFTLTRIGSIVINQTAPGSNNFVCVAAGAIGLSVRSTNPGTGSYAQLLLGNDVSVFASVFQMFSSGYTGSPEPDFAGGLSVKAGQSGGMSLVTQHASGSIRFYTGGVNTKRLELTAAGNAVFSGNITTRGRATADGVWTTIAHLAGNFTGSAAAWTVEAADQIHYRYTYLTANTMLVSFDIRASSVAAATAYLYLKVPDGRTIANNSCGGGVASNNGTTAPLGVFALPSQTQVWLTPSFVGGTAWTGSVHNTAVAGSVILDLL